LLRIELLPNLVVTDGNAAFAEQALRQHRLLCKAPTHLPGLRKVTVGWIPVVRLAPSKRVSHDEQAWTSHRQGWTLDAIAHPVGRRRRTVGRELLPYRTWHGRLSH
jgi:hypothetical protein